MAQPTARTSASEAVLRQSLLAAVDCLHRRRADMIDASHIEDYVALQWMEWHGGGLRLTTVGSNVCAQLTTAMPTDSTKA